MSVVILVQRIDKEGSTFFKYGKPDNLPFDKVTELEQLFSSRAKVYLTGMGALETQRRLVKIVDRLNKDPGVIYKFTRLPVEGGLTANSRISNGAVKPKYGRGG